MGWSIAAVTTVPQRVTASAAEHRWSGCRLSHQTCIVPAVIVAVVALTVGTITAAAPTVTAFCSTA
jgi:hypothetical protein